jgi:hypothetical protein
MRADLAVGNQRGSGLVDVLDRVLDKGLVIAGDIKVSLAEVELLTIRIRLLVCSIDKAQEIGLDWWKYDDNLAPGRKRAQLENEELRQQVTALQAALAEAQALPARSKRAAAPRRRASKQPR